MRETLLAAGAAMFADLGYERTRVADIVARADTSHGNFYRHFKDKDQILLEILEPLIASVRTNSRRPDRANGVPTHAELVASNRAFFRAYAKHRHLLRVMREASSHGGAASSFIDLWLSQRNTFVERTERWLIHLKSDGRVGADIRPRDMAEALGSMTEQIAFVKIGLAERDPGRAEIERLAASCGRIWYLSIFGVAPSIERA